jgi:hypothetical protein
LQTVLIDGVENTHVLERVEGLVVRNSAIKGNKI